MTVLNTAYEKFSEADLEGRYVASADLSASLNCYVGIDSDGKTEVRATGIDGLGLLRVSGDAADEVTQIQTGGIGIGKAGAAITEVGQPVTPTGSSGGKLIPATNDADVVVGRAVTLADGDGDKFSVKLEPPTTLDNSAVTD